MARGKRGEKSRRMRKEEVRKSRRMKKKKGTG